MPVLLALNPNTSIEVSALVARVAAPRLPAGWSLRMATARLGARYIAGEAAAAIAAHAALDALASDIGRHGPPDAVLLACFGDPGLFALQSVCPVPVLGLAEASMRAAARTHGRFAIVTGGPAWVPMLHRLARGLDLGDALAGVEAVDRSGGELAADPALAVEVLGAAARQACRRWPDVSAVLLGGAGLAGLAPRLADAVPVPVLDNVELALAEVPRVVAPVAISPERGPWTGLAPELSQFLGAPSEAWHEPCVRPQSSSPPGEPTS